MKKEVLFAIVLGIIVGLVITFGIYTANKAIQKKTQRDSMTDLTQSTPSPDATASAMTTTIFSPEDGAVVDKDTLQLSGTTFPNATIVIFVDDAQQIVSADPKGNFTAELQLTGGSNVITTIATSINGQQETDQRAVVFSTASLDELPTATSAATPRPSITPVATPKASIKPKASPSIGATP